MIQRLSYHIVRMSFASGAAVLLISCENPGVDKSYSQAEMTQKFGADVKPPILSDEVSGNVDRVKSLLDSEVDADAQAALTLIDEVMQNLELNHHEKTVLIQLKGEAHYHLDKAAIADRPPFDKAIQKNVNTFKIIPSVREVQPLVRRPPNPPIGLQKSGHCDVYFDVTKTGLPIEIKTTYCTQKTLQRPAIESVTKWIYGPKIVNGRALKRVGIENKVVFRVFDKNGNVVPE